MTDKETDCRQAARRFRGGGAGRWLRQECGVGWPDGGLRPPGQKVVPFKKGPDYIDAGWLQLAAGRRCYNLDPFLMSEEAIRRSLQRHARQADIVILEGNRGLYDGVTADGGYSTADLAISLGLPVLLVVNCTKTTRTVAAMILGCLKFDERLDIRGVVLNQIATERQRLLITEAVERYTGVPVLGAIPRLKRDIFPMRHLGMIPHQEYNGSEDALHFLVETVTNSLDLGRIDELMAPLRPDLCAVEAEERAAATGRKDRHSAGCRLPVLLFRKSRGPGEGRCRAGVSECPAGQ